MRKRARQLFTPLAITTCIAIAVIAQDNKPADSPRPLLKQLNEETQSLYREVQAGVYRVQLPPPKWVAPLVAQDQEPAPIEKWAGKLSDAVKKELEAEQKRLKQGQPSAVIATVQKAATQPAATQATQTTQAAVGSWTMSTNGDDVLIFRPGPGGGGALQFDAGGGISKDGQIIAASGRLQVNVVPGGSFTPNNIGLLLDSDGHLLVPICVEKESFENNEIPVMLGDGQMNSARFVASDRQTNISILKLTKPLGTPVKLTKARPAPGNLTMFLAPNTGVGRLIIWTNELRDWGVVVSMEGAVYGFVRQGQFLSAAGCKPVIDQLIQSGQAKRAKIGLGIAEIPTTDDQRRADAALAQQPAVRVNEIAPNGLAKSAGFVAGDIILTLNDQPVGDPASFAAALSADDEKAVFQLLRGGQQQTITIQFNK
jgi:hypothetical protein